MSRHRLPVRDIIWSLVEAIGLLLTGIGIWHHYGWDWASVFWGVAFIAAATLNTWRTADRTDREVDS